MGLYISAGFLTLQIRSRAVYIKLSSSHLEILSLGITIRMLNNRLKVGTYLVALVGTNSCQFVIDHILFSFHKRIVFEKLL